MPSNNNNNINSRDERGGKNLLSVLATQEPEAGAQELKSRLDNVTSQKEQYKICLACLVHPCPLPTHAQGYSSSASSMKTINTACHRPALLREGLCAARSWRPSRSTSWTPRESVGQVWPPSSRCPGGEHGLGKAASWRNRESPTQLC